MSRVIIINFFFLLFLASVALFDGRWSDPARWFIGSTLRIAQFPAEKRVEPPSERLFHFFFLLKGKKSFFYVRERCNYSIEVRRALFSPNFSHSRAPPHLDHWKIRKQSSDVTHRWLIFIFFLLLGFAPAERGMENKNYGEFWAEFRSFFFRVVPTGLRRMKLLFNWNEIELDAMEMNLQASAGATSSGLVHHFFFL